MQPGETVAAPAQKSDDSPNEMIIDYAQIRDHVLGARRDMLTSLDELAARWAPNPAKRAAHHALDHPGKTIRAAVIIAACQAVGGQANLVLPAAAGIEYGHLASLVHDDLIDGDPIRRTRPTVWVEYGQPQAIITGDLLFFAAFHALARCRPQIPADRIVGALEAVALSGIDTCFGASLEMELTGDLGTTMETYLKMAAGKTGSLLRGAAQGGAILGGGSVAQVQAMRTYGESIGVAFQIVDDVLPYLSNDDRLGKSVLSDIRNRRPTLPVVLAMAQGDEDDRRYLEKLFAHDLREDEIAEAYDWVRGCFDRTGALEHAQRLAVEYCATALSGLSELDDNDGTAALSSLAHAACERSA
jgi:geranylgeranyl pyrophosphate synthase